MPKPTNQYPARWRFAVDRGGTFTDVIGFAPDGRIRTQKVLSDVPERAKDAISAAVHAVLHSEGLNPDAVETLRIGTTVATNALLTGQGTRTALVTTRGLGDLSWIRDQSRPDLFALHIHRPKPIANSVIEIDERIDVAGEVVLPIDPHSVRDQLQRAKDQGIEAIAICLLHGWEHDRHESIVRHIAEELEFRQVVSSRDEPMRGFVARMATLSADAALTPTLAQSLQPLLQNFGSERILCMQSSGGLIGPDRFRGVRAILSGPAGGVIGARDVALRAGFSHAVALDMGGTSTDVAWIGGALERSDETRVAGERLRVPMLEVHTIAAGGGSICLFDGQRLRVGPDSAGAVPGPACYRRGGPATLTDCDVVLGRLPVHRLPHVFGQGGDQAPDRDASSAAIKQLAEQIRRATESPMTATDVAEGCLTIAVEATAAAVRRISIERGRDLRGGALVAFGGAGGQVACRVAESLQIETVLFHPLAGVLSAWGIAHADQRALRRRSVERPLSALGDLEIERLAQELSLEAVAELPPSLSVHVEHRLTLRSRDWNQGVNVRLGPVKEMLAEFGAACEQRFGYDPGPEGAVVASIEAEAVASGGPSPAPAPHEQPAGQTRSRHTSADRQSVFLSGAWRDIHAFARSDLAPGDQLTGPALLFEDGATVVIEPGWNGTILSDGTLRCDRSARHPNATNATAGESVDPVLLSVFSHRFRAIADEMGAVLQSTARSVNIRERLDFSCAVFDADGNLVANGQHMPVHLGSMGESVRHVMRVQVAFLPGDAFLLNDPSRGGTHLPDLTLISPVFVAGGEHPSFFVASRGHHADIGGIAPGSMPSLATTLEQEGVVVDCFSLRNAGRVDLDGMRALLTSGRYPCRMPDRVIDDVRAQLAANMRGIESLRALTREYGLPTIAAYTRHLQDYAEHAVRNLLRRCSSGSAVTPMDGGGEIRLSLDIDRARGSAIIDFAGTAPQRPDNFNAPPAVTNAAILYVLRCLLDDDIPLNEGCLRAAEVRIPQASVLRPQPGAAVAAGNVETSQLVVDALFQAFGALANSQGTMNNLSFGNDRVQYYETICGGTGAGPGFGGAHAIQSHMTNSRLTDPEVLEHRFPVRLWRFARRFGSGGIGKWSGGDGAVRELEFLEPMTISLLAGRRQHAPSGAAGGGPAHSGLQMRIRIDGSATKLPGIFTLDFDPHERLIIQTPGGGGWGSPDQS